MLCFGYITIVSTDLILFKRKDQVTDKQNMFLSRIIIIAIAVICSLIALRPPQTLVQLVQDVAYTGLAQLAPLLSPDFIGKVLEKRVLSWTYCRYNYSFATRIMNVSPLGWPGFMWAFGINILLLIFISLLLKKKGYFGHRGKILVTL